MKFDKAVQEYQCCGCMCEGYPKCYKRTDTKDFSCEKHIIGTMTNYCGKILLGLPKGFNRTGKELEISIFKTFKEGWGFTKFNVPVWKYLDTNGNTLVRGIKPRINIPFLHIYLEDCLDKIECIEIMNNDIENMD